MKRSKLNQDFVLFVFDSLEVETGEMISVTPCNLGLPTKPFKLSSSYYFYARK